VTKAWCDRNREIKDARPQVCHAVVITQRRRARTAKRTASRNGEDSESEGTSPVGLERPRHGVHGFVHDAAALLATVPTFGLVRLAGCVFFLTAASKWQQIIEGEEKVFGLIKNLG
jgi:hypothetical protein